MTAHTRALRLAALLAATALCACTARYSQTLVGTIERANSRPVPNSSEGYGLSVQSPLLELTIAAPESAESLASPSCESVMTQVDYRTIWVAVPVGFPFYYIQPEVQTVTFCTVP